MSFIISSAFLLHVVYLLLLISFSIQSFCFSPIVSPSRLLISLLLCFHVFHYLFFSPLPSSSSPSSLDLFLHPVFLFCYRFSFPSIHFSSLFPSLVLSSFCPSPPCLSPSSLDHSLNPDLSNLFLPSFSSLNLYPLFIYRQRPPLTTLLAHPLFLLTSPFIMFILALFLVSFVLFSLLVHSTLFIQSWC